MAPRRPKWPTSQHAPGVSPERDLQTVVQVDADNVPTGVFWVAWHGVWEEVFPPWEQKKRRKGNVKWSKGWHRTADSQLETVS